MSAESTGIAPGKLGCFLGVHDGSFAGIDLVDDNDRVQGLYSYCPLRDEQ